MNIFEYLFTLGINIKKKISPSPSDLYSTLKLQELLVLDSAQKFSEKFLTCGVCRGFGETE